MPGSAAGPVGVERPPEEPTPDDPFDGSTTSSASDLADGVNGDTSVALGGVSGSTDEALSDDDTDTVGGLRYVAVGGSVG